MAVNGIRRVLTRRSLKTNSEGGESLEEQIAFAQLHRVNIRVGSTQVAGWFLQHVALDHVGAASRKNSRRLVGQIFSGVCHFIFNGHFLASMLAELDFLDLPNLFCHICLLYSNTPSLREKRLSHQ
jgi:hypothetical protein